MQWVMNESPSAVGHDRTPFQFIINSVQMLCHKWNTILYFITETRPTAVSLLKQCLGRYVVTETPPNTIWRNKTPLILTLKPISSQCIQSKNNIVRVPFSVHSLYQKMSILRNILCIMKNVCMMKILIWVLPTCPRWPSSEVKHIKNTLQVHHFHSANHICIERLETKNNTGSCLSVLWAHLHIKQDAAIKFQFSSPETHFD